MSMLPHPGMLPYEFSPWAMFLSADGVVKSVICLLVSASMVTWTVLVAKSLDLRRANRRVHAAFAVLENAGSLPQAFDQIDHRDELAVGLVDCASTELRLSAGCLADRDGVKERIASRLERVEAAAGRRMLRGIGWLATIGATAPFVGLFGTVWGVMNSFIGIAQVKSSSLAVVAPGIAEALLATAVGLFAAIPAVIIYNLFVRCLSAYKAGVADCAAAVLRLASRDLSRDVVRNTSVLTVAE